MGNSGARKPSDKESGAEGGECGGTGEVGEGERGGEVAAAATEPAGNGSGAGRGNCRGILLLSMELLI
jgi:hypothetical protein